MLSLMLSLSLFQPPKVVACPPGEGCTIPIPRPPISGRCEKRNQMGRCIVPTRRQNPPIRRIV